jgi:hypothetical protein
MKFDEGSFCTQQLRHMKRVGMPYSTEFKGVDRLRVPALLSVGVFNDSASSAEVL